MLCACMVIGLGAVEPTHGCTLFVCSFFVLEIIVLKIPESRLRGKNIEIVLKSRERLARMVPKEGGKNGIGCPILYDCMSSICTCVYIYIYIYRERERYRYREREREKERDQGEPLV